MKSHIFNRHELLVFENGDVYKKITPPKDGNYGYRKYHFNRKGIFAHRLIADVFIPNPDNKPFINHKDGDPQNNSVENLEWCTAKENTQHSYDVLKRKLSGFAVNPVKGKEHYKASPVLQLNLDGSLIREWSYINEAAQELSISRSSISQALSGKVRQSHGFMWLYKNKKTSKHKWTKKSYPVLCETTGKVYPSIYSVAKEHHHTYSRVLKAMSMGRSLHGLIFKVIEKKVA